MHPFQTTLCVATALFGMSLQQSPITAPPATSPAAIRSMSVWAETAAPVPHCVEQGIPNFGKLNAAVWRSGQPRKDGYSRLAKLGVKTVVNLQLENPRENESLPAGIKYVYIPVADHHKPTNEQAQQFLEVVANPDNWPVLVHCHGGEGRAGVMSALVRYSFDGWDKKRIESEIDNFRVAHLGLFKTKMNSEQRQFLAQWAANNAPGAYRQKISQ